MTDSLKGCRGYIGSRKYDFGEYPQHVQNMVIRTYCQKYSLTYLLSATEYAMQGCYMILHDLIENIESLDGIVLFSIFMLPHSKEKRMKIYDAVLKQNKVIHAALEDISVKNSKDVDSLELIFGLSRAVSSTQNNQFLQLFIK